MVAGSDRERDEAILIIPESADGLFMPEPRRARREPGTELSFDELFPYVEHRELHCCIDGSGYCVLLYRQWYFVADVAGGWAERREIAGGLPKVRRVAYGSAEYRSVLARVGGAR